MTRGGDMSRVMVGMHGFERDHYWKVKDFADVVHQSEKLGVLKLRSNATQEDIFRMWESHASDQKRNQ